MSKKKEENKVMKWDEELAKLAQIAADEEVTATGQFFSLKSGVLSYADSPIPGNEMAVIILDSICENVFYEGDYDPDNITGPVCFAFGRNVKTLTPHKDVVEAGTEISDSCATCENNEWGSADKGKGKACRNTRRLAMIPAGTFDKDGNFEMIKNLDHYENTEPVYMKLPVTSVNGFSSYVNSLASSLKRPPFGVITKVSVVPDPKSQFRVLFQALDNVPDECIAAIVKRHEEIKDLIEFPYSMMTEDEGPEKKPAKKGKAVKKTAGKKRKY